jgi:hypothetical protein
LGYKVTGLDVRPYPFSHPNFNFIQADILTWQPPVGAFDAVISISTLEHIGLGGYGDPLNKQGDMLALEKLWQALSQGGRLYLSLPFGRPCQRRGMRIYDESGIKELVGDMEVFRVFAKPSRYGSWREVSSQEAGSLVYEDYLSVLPVQAVAFIVAVKR